MILLILKTHSNCQKHVYFVNKIRDVKHFASIQKDLIKRIPNNQQRQINKAIGSDQDKINLPNDYHEVKSIDQFIKSLDDPNQFNKRLNTKIKYNSHLQKIRHS